MTTDTQMRERFETHPRFKLLDLAVMRDYGQGFEYLDDNIQNMFEAYCEGCQAATEQMKPLVAAAKDLLTRSISIGLDGRYLPDNDHVRAELKNLLQALATIEGGKHE